MIKPKNVLRKTNAVSQVNGAIGVNVIKSVELETGTEQGEIHIVKRKTSTMPSCSRSHHMHTCVSNSTKYLFTLIPFSLDNHVKSNEGNEHSFTMNINQISNIHSPNYYTKKRPLQYFRLITYPDYIIIMTHYCSNVY